MSSNENYYIKPSETMKVRADTRLVSKESSPFNLKIVSSSEQKSLAGDYNNVQKISTETYVRDVFTLTIQARFQHGTSNASKGVHSAVVFGNPLKFGVAKNGKKGAALAIAFDGQISEIMAVGTPFRLLVSVRTGGLGYGVLTGDPTVDHELRLAGFQDDPSIAMRKAVEAYLMRHPDKLPKVKGTKVSSSSNNGTSLNESAAAAATKKRVLTAEADDRLAKKRKKESKYKPLEIQISPTEICPVNPPQGRDAFGLNQRILMVVGFASLKVDDLPTVLQRLEDEKSHHKWSSTTFHFVLDQFKDIIPEALKPKFVSQVKEKFVHELAPNNSIAADIESSLRFDSFVDGADLTPLFQSDEVTRKSIDTGQVALGACEPQIVILAHADATTDYLPQPMGRPENHPALAKTTRSLPLERVLNNESHASMDDEDLVKVMHGFDQVSTTTFDIDLQTPPVEDTDFWEKLQDMRPPTPSGEASWDPI